jgi:hypothetical protein
MFGVTEEEAFKFRDVTIMEKRLYEISELKVSRIIKKKKSEDVKVELKVTPEEAALLTQRYAHPSGKYVGDDCWVNLVAAIDLITERRSNNTDFEISIDDVIIECRDDYFKTPEYLKYVSWAKAINEKGVLPETCPICGEYIYKGNCEDEACSFNSMTEEEKVAAIVKYADECKAQCTCISCGSKLLSTGECSDINCESHEIIAMHDENGPVWEFV